jgi:hypothetical protein
MEAHHKIEGKKKTNKQTSKQKRESSENQKRATGCSVFGPL